MQSAELETWHPVNVQSVILVTKDVKTSTGGVASVNLGLKSSQERRWLMDQGPQSAHGRDIAILLGKWDPFFRDARWVPC